MAETSPPLSLEQTFKNFWLTWAHRTKGANSMDLIRPYFHPNVSSIGTGSHEKGRDLKEVLLNFEDDFKEMSEGFELIFEYIQSKLITENVGVVEAEGKMTFNLTDDETHTFEMRFTTMFCLEDGKWLLINNHLSIPYLGQDDGQSFPLDKLRAQNKKLQKAVEEKTKKLREHSNLLRQQMRKTEELLFNILPVSVAREMLDHGKTVPKKFENVSVMFTDFVDFTENTRAIQPIALLKELNDIFLEFDSICKSEGLEKIKTIGDAYMAVCGLPVLNSYHAKRTVEAAKRMQDFLAYRNDVNDQQWHMRIGIHSGPVVAGVIGKNKFAYDLWGDTVNIASRLESNCENGKVNISKNTYELIKEFHDCDYRGEIEVKGGRKVEMYFVI